MSCSSDSRFASRGTSSLRSLVRSEAIWQRLLESARPAERPDSRRRDAEGVESHEQSESYEVRSAESREVSFW
jgi:hypothetical protein